MGILKIYSFCSVLVVHKNNSNTLIRPILSLQCRIYRLMAVILFVWIFYKVNLNKFNCQFGLCFLSLYFSPGSLLSTRAISYLWNSFGDSLLYWYPIRGMHHKMTFHSVLVSSNCMFVCFCEQWKSHKNVHIFAKADFILQTYSTMFFMASIGAVLRIEHTQKALRRKKKRMKY